MKHVLPYIVALHLVDVLFRSLRWKYQREPHAKQVTTVMPPDSVLYFITKRHNDYENIWQCKYVCERYTVSIQFEYGT